MQQHQPTATRWLVAAALLASVGFTFRYAGVTLLALPVVVVAVAVAVTDRSRAAVVRQAKSLLGVAARAARPGDQPANLVDGFAAWSVFGPRASGNRDARGGGPRPRCDGADLVLGGALMAAALGWVVLVAVAALVLLVAAEAPSDREGRLRPCPVHRVACCRWSLSSSGVSRTSRRASS